METLKFGSTGTNVKLIQSLLSQIGYNPGPIDGIYGSQTEKAVAQFQLDQGLTPDGIVGTNTWRYFNRFLLGYDEYYIESGDTIYDLAQKYYTTVNAIITANPGIDPENLSIGQKIIIPYGIDVVFTDIDYTYEIMERDIKGLKARYPFLETGSIGKSVLGRELYYIRIGNGPNKISYNGAHHALEWITTPLLMKFIENYSKAYSKGTKIRGYDPQEIWKKSSIYIVPMVNPDGVDLVLNGLKRDNPYYDDLLLWNNTGKPFSEVWKANIRGVDLNLNYPANWEFAKELEPIFNVYGPAPVRYAGPAPLSEPESRAMVDFTKKHNFNLVIAYHTQGRVIYWKFFDIVPPDAERIGELFSTVTGYRLAETLPEDSYAGYKDWFIKDFNKPGYTFEAGIGKNPLPIAQFPTIYSNNEEAMLLAPLV